MAQSKRHKHWLLFLSAVALGGCGIWSMHFTGMSAQSMALSDGTLLQVHFEGGRTVGSLVAAILGVYLGLRVAAKDPFFQEIEANQRKAILVLSAAYFFTGWV